MTFRDVFRDLVNKQRLKKKVDKYADTKLSMENMRDWAREWNRKEPRWTSVYYWEDPTPLKIVQGYFNWAGFATRVRKGEGKSDRYYLDIYGWNSWCNETGKPLPVTKAHHVNKLKKVC